MFKKGDLTINIIVIAVIALIVLVILITIFSGKLSIFNLGTERETKKTCEGEITQGKIVSYTSNCPEGYITSTAAYTDVQPGYKCCIQIKD